MKRTVVNINSFQPSENISCKPLQEHVHLPNFEVIAIKSGFC